MSIKEFIGRYEAFIDPDQHENFRRDFWTVIDKLGDDRFRQVAIEVLGDLEGSELKMYHQSNPLNGIIGWGKKGRVEETGWMVYYSPAIGQQGGDWLWLLRNVAQSALRS